MPSIFDSFSSLSGLQNLYLFQANTAATAGAKHPIDFRPAWETLRDTVIGMATDFIARIPYFIVALLILGLAYVIANRVRYVLAFGANRTHRGANFSALVARTGGWLVIAFGALIAATVAFPSFTPATLVSLLGLGGVAAGFAFRDILGNLLCGLVLLASEPFRIGDRIEVKGYQGEVEDVQTRATTIRTRDGRRVVIPNTVVFNEPIEVVTAFANRRLETSIPLKGDNWQQDKERALEAMRSVPGVENDPPACAFILEWKDSGAVLGLRWWINNESIEVESASRDAVLNAVAGVLKVAPEPAPPPVEETAS